MNIVTYKNKITKCIMHIQVTQKTDRTENELYLIMKCLFITSIDVKSPGKTNIKIGNIIIV